MAAMSMEDAEETAKQNGCQLSTDKSSQHNEDDLQKVSSGSDSAKSLSELLKKLKKGLLKRVLLLNLFVI